MSRRPGSAASLAVLTALLASAALLLREPARAVRREVLVERALDALEAGLERHRATHGTYPDEPELSAGELARWLRDGGAMESLPDNPDTGLPYGQVDLEADLAFYAAEPGGSRYRLEVLVPDGTRVVAVRRGPRAGR